MGRKSKNAASNVDANNADQDQFDEPTTTTTPMEETKTPETTVQRKSLSHLFWRQMRKLLT